MKVFVAGLNHRTAEIDDREKLAFNGNKLVEGLEKFKNLPGIKEAMILSTCNRVELYANVENIAEASESVKTFLSEYHNINRDHLNKLLYIYDDIDAVRHIFRVTSSLDSMVVGEPQILGQFKSAFEIAHKHKTTGMLLNRLMSKAISVGKKVRRETRIAEHAISVSFVAVELARKIFSDLSGKVSMLLGAGEMSELAARHLVNNGVKEVIVANRRYERACELAKEFNGRPVAFDEFLQEMVRADIVICSTGAQHFILTKAQVHKVMKERKQRPVFIIDISVPRNVDPEVGDLDNVYLYNIDDLKDFVDKNKFERQKEAEKAEQIVEDALEPFLKWMSSLDSVPTIVALRDKSAEIKQEELIKLLNKFPELGEKEREAIEHMAAAIINKLIHPPTMALKENGEDRDTLIAAIRRLYGIDETESKEK